MKARLCAANEAHIPAPIYGFTEGSEARDLEDANVLLEELSA